MIFFFRQLPGRESAKFTIDLFVQCLTQLQEYDQRLYVPLNIYIQMDPHNYYHPI